MEHETNECGALRLRCYQCSEGCVHLTCGNTTLTFAPEQFRVLADVVNEVRRRIDIQRELDLNLLDAPHAPVM